MRPIHITSLKKPKYVNLLLLQNYYIDKEEEKLEKGHDDTAFHYVWIKDLSRLIIAEVSISKRKIYECDRCLHYLRSMEKL